MVENAQPEMQPQTGPEYRRPPESGAPMSQQDTLMKRHQKIERLIHRVFADDPEQVRSNGFDNVQVQHYFAETAEKWVRCIRHQGGYLDPETEEQDLVIIDDAWLKIAQIMWTKDRKLSRGQRSRSFANKTYDEWAFHAITDVRKRRQIFERAGELVCQVSSLGIEPIIYMRDDDAPTIIDALDPVQLLIPAPVLSNVNQSKVIESLKEDKPKTVTILAEALESCLDFLKGANEMLIAGEIRPEHVQGVQILVLEDILFNEHGYDIEDFKQTVMHHRLLEDQLIVKLISDGLQQVQQYFQDKFPEEN